MSSGFRKVTSNIFVSAFVALIFVSFMFTGNEFLVSSPDEVATVGNTKIKYSDYELELKRQMQFYTQFTGGKELTQKQVEQYNLKGNSINNLLARSLMGMVAAEMGATPSSAEIKADIKNQPYFKTNEVFDLNRYKAVLANAGITPEEFEKQTKQQLEIKRIQNVLSALPISSTYMQAAEKLRESKRTLQYVSFTPESLKSQLPVSKREIDDFLANEASLNNVKAIFESKKAQLSTPDQVLASHILLRADASNDAEIKKKIDEIHAKLTPENFAKTANEVSEDGNQDPQTGEKKGGDLGWFSKGRMVPEFENAAFGTEKGKISKPVKTQFGYHILYVRDKKPAVIANFDDHKETIAKSEIINTKMDLLDKLAEELESKVFDALRNNSISSLKGLQEKFGFTLLTDLEVNRLEGLPEEHKVENDQFQALFDQEINKVHKFKTLNKYTIIKVQKYVEKPKEKVELAEGEEPTPEPTLEDKKNQLSNLLGRKISQNIINLKRQDAKIKVYNNRL